MHNYASLQETQDQEEQGILFHVSEPTRSRWNHIVDLDSFFTRVYKYHQKHGFTCMVLKELFGLNQFVFVIFFTVYLFYGVDYNVLFNYTDGKKRIITEAMLPISECIKYFSPFTWFLLIFAAGMFVLKAIRQFYVMIMYWDIKQFYNTALNIKDKDLDNLTWYEVQNKLKQVQLEQQICIHKRELTELDIYHRILRQENYFVAMVNKKLIPPRIYMPFLGDIVYWTKGMRYNIVGLLFWSPWSPFENPWHLREEYKRQSLRQELASQLSRQILWLAFLNLIFSPLIFIWQIIFYFFNYFELVRREPGKFGVRYWSQYARMYLRHFNELDHELHARLTRAYRPASKYLSSFTSPTASVIAEHVAFICSSILGVFLILSFYDNEFLYIEQVLSIMAFLTGAIAVCRSMVPDEYSIWCPEALLQAVVLHTHYFPGKWQGLAHTSHVRASFQQLFQFRFAALIEEFISPVITPYFLVRYVYPRSLDIVDFFRNFTVSVVGVGDVCSFAQMDIRKHGNPDWQAADTEGVETQVLPDQYSQAEDGKVELSLMHFTATNPEWVPPEEAKDFVENVQHETSGAYGNLATMGFWDSSSMVDYEDLSLPAGHRDSIYVSHVNQSTKRSGQRWMAEGPDLFSSASNMRASTLILHNRHANSR
ncbi:autophagy-related protein 9A isoform X2 [Cylas formicarius]|uniref:autophagy-related protein 9A isoform X2 n=1 Tax=Cylas formicarius TaxID=197179 RepID=UPI002958ACC9|nr:autophagy-related protein 9A isoform X2 [Cylas formicarius]